MHYIFHIFPVMQNTVACRTGSDYLNTNCAVSPLHKCLEVTRVYRKWSYWYFSTAVTAHQEGGDNTNQGMEFSQSCSVKRLYKQLIPYTRMGFLARGNPRGIGMEIQNGFLRGRRLVPWMPPKENSEQGKLISKLHARWKNQNSQ